MNAEAANAGTFDEDRLAERYEAARVAERAGRLDDAAAAYGDCLVIDPADHVGARIRMAGLLGGDIPESAGNAYVATLFDQHAESFEDILVRQLRYDVPEQLAGMLLGGGERFSRVLDLGCGTGLAGEALRDAADHITGVDLSEEMVRVTSEKEVYDRLFVAEAVAFLERHEDETPYDLIVATDVLPYLGSLDPFLRAAMRRMPSGGLIGLSTETMEPEELRGQPYAVGKAQRFHHGAPYVRERLVENGFEIVHFENITVRLQEGEPAPGHLVVARKL